MPFGLDYSGSTGSKKKVAQQVKISLENEKHTLRIETYLVSADSDK